MDRLSGQHNDVAEDSAKGGSSIESVQAGNESREKRAAIRIGDLQLAVARERDRHNVGPSDRTVVRIGETHLKGAGSLGCTGNRGREQRNEEHERKERLHREHSIGRRTAEPRGE